VTDIIDRTDDLLRLPATDALPALRAQGLLPATTTETIFRPDPAQVQPVVAPLAQLEPNKPFVAGKARCSTFDPQWVITGPAQEVAIYDDPGLPGGVIYFSFQGLGANRKCVAWFDLRVYGPGSSSLTIGGSGNPSVVKVTNSATSGQRVWVPFAFTATAGGEGILYLVPSQVASGGVWFGTSVYGF
jgi:hypothetical protein